MSAPSKTIRGLAAARPRRRMPLLALALAEHLHDNRRKASTKSTSSFKSSITPSPSLLRAGGLTATPAHPRDLESDCLLACATKKQSHAGGNVCARRRMPLLASAAASRVHESRRKTKSKSSIKNWITPSPSNVSVRGVLRLLPPTREAPGMVPPRLGHRNNTGVGCGAPVTAHFVEARHGDFQPGTRESPHRPGQRLC